MNLICFSNQTAGGLLCDLLNGANYSVFNLYQINSPTHAAFKIGDRQNVYRTFDEQAWTQKVAKLDRWTADQLKNLWVGTHCHPSCIPNKHLQMFDKIIAITTENNRSKLLRFIRAYHGMYKMRGGKWNGPEPGYKIQDDSFYFANKVEDIKNLCNHTCMTFESHLSCINIEFEHIVDGSYVKEHNLNMTLFEEWKKFNPWLYKPIDSFLLQIFNETIEQ